ncbi:MAG TPA: hypothetical protein PKZ76_13425 [Xanthomonadaceae bacterium]|nr:hypothetical protein [Xanthomonadaceae bacterium]
MAIEIQARPVNWCPRAERRRRHARIMLLGIMTLGLMFWVIGGFAT